MKIDGDLLILLLFVVCPSVVLFPDDNRVRIQRQQLINIPHDVLSQGHLHPANNRMRSSWPVLHEKAQEKQRRLLL